MRKIKAIVSSTVAAAMVATMLMSVSAADKIDYTKKENAIAKLAPNTAVTLAVDYVVSSAANWIMSNGVGVGAEGWTDLDRKSDGSDIYHYSNMRVYLNSQYWESGRQWGYGQVYASTGNVGMGALTNYNLYYGF